MPERAQHVLFFAASAPCTGHAVLDAVLDAAVGERLLEAMLQVAKRSGLALQRHCIAASGRKEWPCVCGWDAMQQLASDGVHLFFVCLWRARCITSHALVYTADASMDVVGGIQPCILLIRCWSLISHG